MEFNKITVRTLSILGQRGVFGQTLVELASQNQNIFALSADLCNTSGLNRFKKKYPARFINTGIAEQNMIGIAAGLAALGRIPFATTFANFAALRACEQVRHYMGYMQENVKLVGFGSGFSFGMFGTTHYALEDISVLRSINNLTILSPADGVSVVKAVQQASLIKGPVYLRLSGTQNNPIVYTNDFNFNVGKMVVLREGKDIVIFATGTMVYNSLKVSDNLEQKGLSVGVVDVHTIKPIDSDEIKKALDAKMIVTVEEHSQYGGLGAAVAEVLAIKQNKPPHLIIGTKDEYLHAGDYNYMQDIHGLSVEKLEAKIFNTYKEIVE